MSQSVIGSLRVNLGLDSAQFQQGLQQTRSSLSRIGPMFARLAGGAAAVGTAMVAAGTKAATAARELQNQARLSNASIEEFQRAAFAAKTVGIEQEKLSDIFKDVNDRVGDFLATGGGPMADFFENIAPKVGLTAEHFATLSGPEALQAYVKALEDAGVSQQEMTFYLEAMASDATALAPLLADNGAEMRRLGDEAERFGLVGADTAASGVALDEAFRKMSAAVMAVANAIVETGIIDLLAAILTRLAEMIVVAIDVSTGFRDMAAGVVAAAQEMVEGISQWFSESHLGRALGYMQSAAESVSGWWRKTQDDVTGNSYVPDMVMAIEHWFARMAKTAPALAEQGTKAVSSAFEGVQRSVETSVRGAVDAVASGTFRMRNFLAGLAVDLAQVGVTSLVQIAGGAIAGALGGGGALFGGPAGIGFGHALEGFATGGSFTVGGAGGIDSQLVQFRATPGEMVDIRRPGQSGGGGTVTIALAPGLRADFMDDAARQSVRITQAAMSGPGFDQRVARASRNSRSDRL